ncbi:hypothetical protein [Cellulomonas sp.]|uniref:hypothetical protein n=1 Tax=Cellulomonas sp. TaxID=40001 RepID=UPI0028123B57|nr:hypothetical protein [Cellulomonas sp.]
MRARALVGVLAVTSLAPALAACAGGAPEPDPDLPAVYAAEFDRVLAGDPSDLEREVLEDRRITDAEYATARDAFRQCAEDAHYEVTFLEGGGFDIGPGPQVQDAHGSDEEALAAMDAVVAGCEDGTTASIGYLYEAMRSNPEGSTGVQVIRACFAEKGVPDGDGLSEEQLTQLLHDESYVPSSDAARACVVDPTGQLSPGELAEAVEQARTSAEVPAP